MVSEGKLIKNKVIELSLNLDSQLLKHLIKNTSLKKHFFSDIDGTLVFDKIKFQKFVNNKQFLPDSYTSFKNKIGLVSNDEYLSESKNVVLAFPYKDCVLEGGQDKEDAKREEIFWNETLAPDQIDRLLSPKVLTNFKRYTKDGEEQVASFNENDNLIIKGNNLIVLYTLLNKYRGKVKLIYIDPPYNTGSDSFKYNDSFNHSTWLTFMKNRLEVAKELLRDDGAIFVHIDHHELGYINVLMDEIFGIENKVQVISIKTSSPAGFKTVNPGPIDVTEYIFFYTKKKSAYKFKKGYVAVGYDKNYNRVVTRTSEDVKEWKFKPIKEVVLKQHGFDKEEDAKRTYSESWKSVLKFWIESYAARNSENVVSIRDPHKPTKQVQELLTESKKVDYVLEYKREDGTSGYIYKGGALAFYSNKMQNIDGQMAVTELLSDFWSHISWAGIANEGGVKLKNGKKPEKLLKQILDISTEPGDLVLDYHIGSGTTAAVAHKMNRQYIGIEQMNYIETLVVERLKKIIDGEQGGISKSVNWQGGGSFVYCELAKANQIFIESIQDAKNTEELITIWNEMQDKAFLSYLFNKKSFDKLRANFLELTISEQKKFLIEILDKNMLYVPLSETDDQTYKITESDKILNKHFFD